jgi:hypothetical protein
MLGSSLISQRYFGLFYKGATENMKKIKARQSDIVVQTLKKETLIYDLTGNKAFCLNETSGLVWEMCDGRHSVEEIADRVGEKLNQPVTTEVVHLALDQLNRDNLLENGDQTEQYFAGMNRREVIRRIGFGTGIALPLISSIVAPMATAAQSGAISTCTGTCLPAGNTNFCIPTGCNGDFITAVFYASTNGSCTGPAGTPVIRTCFPGASTPSDSCVTDCTSFPV